MLISRLKLFSDAITIMQEKMKASSTGLQMN